MKHIIFSLFFIAVLGCKEDSKKDTNSLDAIVNSGIPTDPSKLTVPNACEIITQDELKSILSLKGSNLNVKESNDPNSDKTKSCFFKWEDSNTPNAGILIQIQTNPVYEDYPQYISNYVTAKLTEGETVMGNDKPTIYKKFDAGGISGAYSFDQARFYWNVGNDYLFMLAFNVSTFSEKTMVNVAEEIAESVNGHFAEKVKK